MSESKHRRTMAQMNDYVYSTTKPELAADPYNMNQNELMFVLWKRWNRDDDGKRGKALRNLIVWLPISIVMRWFFVDMNPLNGYVELRKKLPAWNVQPVEGIIIVA